MFIWFLLIPFSYICIYSSSQIYSSSSWFDEELSPDDEIPSSFEGFFGTLIFFTSKVKFPEFFGHFL